LSAAAGFFPAQAQQTEAASAAPLVPQVQVALPVSGNTPLPAPTIIPGADLSLPAAIGAQQLEPVFPAPAQASHVLPQTQPISTVNEKRPPAKAADAASYTKEVRTAGTQQTHRTETGGTTDSDTQADDLKKTLRQAGIIEDTEPQTGTPADEALQQAGRVVFDQGRAFDSGMLQEPSAVIPAAQSGSRTQDKPWSKLLRAILRQDELPSWPGKPGDTLRVRGFKHALGTKVSQTQESSLYKVQWERTLHVKLFSSFEDFSLERARLEDLAKTSLPHTRLIFADPRTLSLALDIPEEHSSMSLAAGQLQPHQKNALADLAVRLILEGRRARIGPKNLRWDHSAATNWVILDADAPRSAPDKALAEFLRPELLALARIDPVEFLSALRGRLGPDSAHWKALLSSKDAAVREAVSALLRADSLRPKPPSLRFLSEAPDPRFNESWTRPSDLKKLLGEDPLSIPLSIALHGDDPGKLNTVVREVRLKSGKPIVLKTSDLEVVRNELFMRKAVRRWFSAYFDTPHAAAVLDGREGTLVMEKSPGSRSYTGGNDMRMDQRIALALLAHTFGLWDMNTGNVLYSDGKKPVLFDFEQALGTHRPAQRLGIQSILEEMPWVNGRNLPSIEDCAPAIRAWRSLMADPAVRQELSRMLLETGWTPAQVQERLSHIDNNLSQLDWLILSDLEFARAFAK